MRRRPTNSLRSNLGRYNPPIADRMRSLPEIMRSRISEHTDQFPGNVPHHLPVVCLNQPFCRGVLSYDWLTGTARDS